MRIDPSQSITTLSALIGSNFSAAKGTTAIVINAHGRAQRRWAIFRCSKANRCRLPFTLGHEIAGEVVAIGYDFKHVRAGQRFVVFPRMSCGTRAFFNDGDGLLCPTPRTVGSRRDGDYADHVIVQHPRYLVDHGNTCPYSKL
jgi:D-arabinose 1-dehydrogenase-like Zn-dependent alcohol dehydrogenase